MVKKPFNKGFITSSFFLKWLDRNYACICFVSEGCVELSAMFCHAKPIICRMLFFGVKGSKV